MRSLIAGLLLLASSAVVCADGAIVIGDDPGGNVQEYLQKYDALRQTHTPVILAGDCVSACSFVLTLPRSQVCALPGSRLGFHGASRTPGGPVDLKASKQIGRLFYPPSVRPYLNTPAVHYEPARRFFGPC